MDDQQIGFTQEEPLPSETDEYFKRDPFKEDPEEQPSRWRKIVVTVLVTLILLLLFCPVPKEQLSKISARAQKERQAQRAGTAGAAKYVVISGGPLKELDDGAKREAIPVGVWFEVQNLSGNAEILDPSMVQLVDTFGYESVINPKAIEAWYELKGMSSPWGEGVEPGAKVKALAVFYVYLGPTKTYMLRGRGFDWTVSDFKDFLVGSFSTMDSR